MQQIVSMAVPTLQPGDTFVFIPPLVTTNAEARTRATENRKPRFWDGYLFQLIREHPCGAQECVIKEPPPQTKPTTNQGERP